MQAYLLRHAEAESGHPDHQRRLTSRGRADIRRLGEFLRDNDGFTANTLWTSPLVRAGETADVLSETLGWHPDRSVVEGLTPDDSPERITARLEELDAGQNPLLIGHEPHLGELASLLLTGAWEPYLVTVKKATLLRIDRIDSQWGGRPHFRWTLRWMITPKLLPRG